MDVYCGDCLDVLRGMPAGLVDAVVTDPPAGISFMGKGWDSSKGGRTSWVAWLAERLAECLRVTKSGGHAFVWALPRTSHWTATAIEDAGWVIEDRVAHIFGTGFPKHKSKLKPAVEDWWLATKPGGAKWLGVDACRIEGASVQCTRSNSFGVINDDGWKESNKVFESHPSGRWPTNLVLSHHPECKPNGVRRVRGSGSIKGTESSRLTKHTCGNWDTRYPFQAYADADGTETVEAFDCHPDCPVAMVDEQSGESVSRDNVRHNHKFKSVAKGREKERDSFGHADFGGASRYFPRFLYCPKASRKDRGEGNIHPTVKSFDLMRWLCKLVTPPGGTVLDPFAGSGSTGFAAESEGFGAILIEQSEQYVSIIRARQSAVAAETPLFM